MHKLIFKPLLTNIAFNLTAAAASIWLYGCQSGVIDVGRKAQADTTPPVITDLVFPTSGSFLPEGSVVITGTLTDPTEEGSGFNQDHPVYLDIEVWGQPVSTTPLLEPIRTQRFIVNNRYPGDPDPSFFDWATGNFRFELGTYLRLKPGRLVFHIYGEDACGNVYGPITSNVISGDVPGADLADLYSARQAYGNKLLTLLNSFRTCLAIYGQQYEADIEILNILHDFVQNTYVSNPAIEAWSSELDSLSASINEVNYPDPLIQAGLEETVVGLRVIFDAHLYVNSYPYYPTGMSKPEIVALRQKIVDRYTNDVFAAIITPLTPPANGVSCHVSLQTCDLLLHENSMMNIGDFTIVADPAQPLIMTGYIGWQGNRVVLSPEDYDPPIKMLRLFGETAVEGAFTKFW